MSSSPAKPWLKEIQLARGVAIIAVLVIHATATPVATLDPRSQLFLGYVVVNRLAQFAVPLFMMISALTLSYQLSGRHPVDWPAFYRKRWYKVVVPYLAWATFYMLVRIVVLDDPIPTLGHVVFWYTSGKVYYHLYFMSAVIQLYLLFPLVLRGWRRLNLGFGTTVLVFAALQAVLYWLIKTHVYPYFPYPSTIVFSYSLPVTLGLWLGTHSEDWGAWWRRYRSWVVVATLCGAVAYVGLFVAGTRGTEVSSSLSQASWYLYVSAAGIVVLFASRWVLGLGAPPMAHLAGWLERVGELSFGIYLVHPAILALWQKVWHPSQPLAFHLSVIASLPVMLLLSWLTMVVAQQTPLAGILFGQRRARPQRAPAGH